MYCLRIFSCVFFKKNFLTNNLNLLVSKNNNIRNVHPNAVLGFDSQLVSRKIKEKEERGKWSAWWWGYLLVHVSWFWNPRWIRRCREGNGRGGGVKRRRSGGALCGRRRLPWSWGSARASRPSRTPSLRSPAPAPSRWVEEPMLRWRS